MKIKKMAATTLLMLILSLYISPCATIASAPVEKQSLQEFINTTDDITASYKYPSLKIASASDDKVKLPGHSPIVIKCSETISTKDVVSGSTVKFSVVHDIKDNSGNVLIKAGTPVTAQISFARKNGMIGRSGEVTVNDFHTTAVDGTYVALSGSVSAKPDDDMVMSVVLSVLICPLFLLMKGEEARVLAGATKIAYTIADIYIKPQEKANYL